MKSFKTRLLFLFLSAVLLIFGLGVIHSASPVWQEFPSMCLNNSTYSFLDLRNYVFDNEDGKNLLFSLEQSFVPGFDCTINDNSFLSCLISTNKHLYKELIFTATDRNGNKSTRVMNLGANCFDLNGNDSNSSGNGFVFESENKKLCLEKCTSHTEQVKLINNSYQRRCLSFDTIARPTNLLSVSIPREEICLNSKESTIIPLSINTCGAEERNYQVGLYALDTNMELWYDVQVGMCNNYGGFRINEFDDKVCQGDEIKIPIDVRNQSAFSKKIWLRADNSTMLPFFEKNFVILNSGEQEEVRLVVNAKHAPLGKQAIVLSGQSDNYVIEKRLVIDVIDCSSIKKRTFELTTQNFCPDVRRGGKVEGQFKIERVSTGCNECSFREKEFYLSLNGYRNELSYNTVSLLAGQEKSITYTIFVPTDVVAGKNYATVSATDGHEWNSYTQSKNICFNVLGEYSSMFFFTEQSVELYPGEEVDLELNAVNNGDLGDSYSISVIQKPSRISLNVSELDFRLNSGESKKIRVRISADLNALVAKDQLITLALSGKTLSKASIVVSIKQKKVPSVIELLSSPRRIILDANSTKEFVLTLRNNSNEDLNAIIDFNSLPNIIKFDKNFLFVPKNSISVHQIAITSADLNGVFNVNMKISAPRVTIIKTFEVEVLPQRAKFAASGLFAGFFGLEGNLVLIIPMVIGLIILVALIVVGVRVFASAKNDAYKKENWMRN